MQPLIVLKVLSLLNTYQLMLASFSVFMLPPLLFALCSGFWCSVFALYIGWTLGPKLNQNNEICFLGIALGVFLWISLFLPLLNEQNCSANNCSDYPKLLMYMSLVGATPLAAFPAILLYGPGKKPRNPK